ncbi:MAG: SMI1/KNR4 family protein [Roseivirga sp.]|nr:SMI1/KNR4 family protein [Roseivirga sp.]
MDIIQRFVDVGLEKYSSLATPDWDPMYIEKEEIQDSRFIDAEKPKKEGLLAWKPIESLITDDEILEVENELKYPLPESFKAYLKYKNFYELDVMSEVFLFRPLIPGIWKNNILDATFNGYPREFIYDKGLIPFGRYSDWGLTCFNTNKSAGGAEYEIVIWDHDDPYESEFRAESFDKMLKAILDNYE